MPTPPPPSKAVSIEYYEVDARTGIRVTGTFVVSMSSTAQSQRLPFAAMESEIEAAILAVLIKHSNATVN